MPYTEVPCSFGVQHHRMDALLGVQSSTVPSLIFVRAHVLTMEQDNAPANGAATGMRALLVGGLHEDKDRMVTAVHKRGDALFNGV